MERKKIYMALSFCVIGFFLWSCSKIEKDTRKFMNEGRRTFEELLTEGDLTDNLPHWDLGSTENDLGYKTGVWTHANGTSADFFWQFNAYGNLDFYLDPEVKVDVRQLCSVIIYPVNMM